MKIFKSLSDS